MDNDANNINDEKDPQSIAVRDSKSNNAKSAYLSHLVSGCYSNDLNVQFKCIRLIRILLSKAENTTIQQVVDTGVIPRIVQFCQNNEHPELQYESVWALLNIASGPDCIAQVILNGAHNVLIDLLQHSSYEIREQSLVVLGNIAGGAVQSKDMLLKNKNMLPYMLEICSSTFDKQCVTNLNPNSSKVNTNPSIQWTTLLNTASWTISNFCRGSSPAGKHLDCIIRCLHYLLNQALSMKNDLFIERDEIILNVAWSFAYLTCDDMHYTLIIDKLMQLGIIQKFVDLMEHKNWSVRHPIGRVIGNVLTGTDKQTKQMLNCGILSKYVNMLQHSTESRQQREICWCISNICAGPVGDKLLVLKSNLVPILIDYVRNKPYACAKEGLWAICNLATKSDKRVIKPLVDLGIINALAVFLRKMIDNNKIRERSKHKILVIILESVDNIINAGNTIICGKDVNIYAPVMDAYGIVRCLEDLKSDHISGEVHQQCFDIIETNFKDINLLNTYKNNYVRPLVFGYVNETRNECKPSMYIPTDILQTLLAFYFRKV